MRLSDWPDLKKIGQGNTNRRWIAAIALGGAGFWLNGFPVSVGWGLDFVFGSALIFAGLRVLSPVQVLLAGTVAAARSILLWHHPWAWLAWTVEAGILARPANRTSPVRRDVLFWLLAGSPLLWIGYGHAMGMDGASLGVVVLKQAINGVLNVALGEFLFIFIAISGRRWWAPTTVAVPLESAVLSTFVAVATVPALLFLRVDATYRQDTIDSFVRARLTESLEIADTRISDLRAGNLAQPEKLSEIVGAKIEAATSSDVQILLVLPSGRRYALTRPDLYAVSGSSFADRADARRSDPRKADPSPMSNSRDKRYVAFKRLDEGPGWQIEAITSARREILQQRLTQTRLLLALAIIVAVLSVLAVVLSWEFRKALGAIARSAADLAALGGERQQIRNFFIKEVADIFRSLQLTGTHVSEERQALETARRRLQSIARHSPLVVYTVPADHGQNCGLSSISDTVKVLLGYDPEEVYVPGWWKDRVHPDDLAAATRARQDLSPGAPIQQEYRLRHKQGHYIWVYDGLSLEDGDAGEAVGVIIDISERKMATDKLLQAGRMESLGRMAAGVAHELNQPLNFIKLATLNLTNRLSAGRWDAAYAYQKFDLILAQVERAATIVGQVRTFGRASAGDAELIALDGAVREVLDLLDWQLRNVGIEVELICPAGEVLVRGNPARLSQVRINLLLNARDAIKARLAGASAPAGRIVITVANSGITSTVTVEDNGTGIPPHEISLLFEPFFSTKGPQEGTGLGLSVSYGIVSDLGGTITAENTGSGARFTVSLPHAVDGNAQSAA